MSNYLSEAFKKLDILDEDIFEVDKDGLTALKDFEDSDDEEELITVVDPDAEDEEELEDSYIGKVILDCSVCHTDIYKDKEDITIDDESGLANIGEECPYCYSSEGFKVIGEVKPFVEVEVDTDDDVDVEVDDEEVEEDEEKNESLSGYKKIAESIYKKDKRFLNEAARLNFKKFGIDRLPEEDFSDDGTRFRMFVCDGMPISFARSAGKAYLAIRPDYLSELSYKEYSKLPTYRDCDKYNGVPEEDVDLSDVAEICKKLKAEYDEAVDRKLNNTSKNEACGGKRKSRKFEEAVSKENNKRFGAVAFENGKQVDSAFSDREEDIARWIGDNYYFFDTIKVINNLDGKSSEMKVSFKKNDPSFVLKEIVSAFKQAGIEYSLNKRFSESLKRKIKKIMESIEDITIDTGDQEITVSAKDKEEVESDGEMIAPLSDEVKADIETGSDDTVDVDVDEFSEEDFDELGESYLKKVYENVESYKTTSAKTKGNKLYLEGLIKFNSGKQKKTSFVFESKTITKTGKAKLIGENLQISRGHKSFKLTGTINNGKFISESLNYNYRVKNGNESQRVYGTAKKSK